MTASAPGAAYRIYAAITAATAPIFRAFVTRRMTNAGVPAVRIAERFGSATEARKDGPLIWFHAVSVGEALSILGLIREMGHRRPDARFLITSVSHTSAKLVAERKPPRTVHQFAPIDTPGAVDAFLNHWQPSLACFVESEFWPRLIIEAHGHGIPLALVNARMSAKSRKRWGFVGGTARALLARFDVMLAQMDDGAEALHELGADPARVHVSGNLKAASDRLPVDETVFETFRRQTNGWRLWVAASTHPGEEAIVSAAHDGDRLLILVPRHPERGDEVAEEMRSAGWQVAQRSKGEDLDPSTQVYLADTLGEIGIWYALAPVVFLGGSLKEVGGHNPFEPAQFSAPVLYGPHVANFRETYSEMDKAGAARLVTNAQELRDALHSLDEPAALHRMRDAAHAFTQARENIRTAVADRLIPLIDG